MSAFLRALCLFCLAQVAFAKPATTLKIPETTTFETPKDSPWYVRAMLTEDVPFAGAAGAGFAAGHMGEFVFYDFQAAFYKATYGAVHVDQSGATGSTPLDPTSEVGRPRSNADTATMFSLGAGVGFMFKLLKSDDWVEIGRFGLNYFQYQDSTNSLSFRGPLANFHGEVGYRLSNRVMLAPGATLNVAYVSRTGDAKAPATGSFPHDKFLPLSWWAWELGIYFFL